MLWRAWKFTKIVFFFQDILIPSDFDSGEEVQLSDNDPINDDDDSSIIIDTNDPGNYFVIS